MENLLSSPLILGVRKDSYRENTFRVGFLCSSTHSGVQRSEHRTKARARVNNPQNLGPSPFPLVQASTQRCWRHPQNTSCHRTLQTSFSVSGGPFSFCFVLFYFPLVLLNSL